MNSRYAVAFSTLAGVAIGAVSVGGLYAQGKAPGAYVVVAFSDLGDSATFNSTVAERAPEIIKKQGGHFLVRTNDITVLRPADPPLKRYVLIGFDSAQQAKDWYNSSEIKPINSYNEEHTKGRAFLVEAAPQ